MVSRCTRSPTARTSPARRRVSNTAARIGTTATGDGSLMVVLPIGTYLILLYKARFSIAKMSKYRCLSNESWNYPMLLGS